MKMRRICATPHLGEELLEKMGIFERTPEKKVETPRKKGEPVKADLYRMITKAVMWRDYVKNFEEILIGQNAGFALGCVQIWETGGSIF